MRALRVIILRAAGTNCDYETERAWEAAGAEPQRVHLSEVIERPAKLGEYQVLTLPGGFSYGDDLGAGRIFAAQIQRHLHDQIRAFVDRGGLVLGICNGFQILVKAGLLPSISTDARQSGCTVTYNEPGGFQDRWVCVRAKESPCAFLEPGRAYELPIAHGEGRVLFADDAGLRTVQQNRQDALLYAPGGDGADSHPYNPNGSTADIAGMCDETGRIFGLMPHPDRFIIWQQHPAWTSLPPREAGDGLGMFKRAIASLA